MLIDWCSLTVKDVNKIEEVFFILGLDKNNFEFLESGHFGYTHSCKMGSLFIYYHPERHEMGYHIVMSGQACRDYEIALSEREFDWADFFYWALHFKAKFTRLDVAIDCFDNELELSKIRATLRKGGCITRIKYVSEYAKIETSDGSIAGRTLYFGSRTSDLMIRMYDKKQERLDKHYVVPFDTWVRCELEIKHDAANNFAEIIANGNDLGLVVKGVLSNTMRFVKGTKDKIISAKNNKNQDRLETTDWWDNFIGNVQCLKITGKATETNIEKSTDWFIHSASKQLAKLDYLMGSNYIDEIKKMGKKKLTDQELEQLANQKNFDTNLKKILNLKIQHNNIK